MSDQPVPESKETPSAAPAGTPSAAPAAPSAPGVPRSEGHSGGGGHRSEGHSGGGGPRREGFGGGGGGGRPREGGGPGGPGGGPGGPRRGGKRQFFRKKKVCRFCVERVDFIDYKKVEMLQPFVQERGKILPRRMTGTCSRHQRWLGEAIKRARNIALMPFATEL
jgi:small subunit ribosomal protein S18